MEGKLGVRKAALGRQKARISELCRTKAKRGRIAETGKKLTPG